MRDRLAHHDWNYGFIVDGFPRNARQAEFFLESYDIDGVINLELPDEEVERASARRRLCSGCGLDYNLIAHRPTVRRRLRRVRGPLVVRAPTTRPRRSPSRLHDYHEKTAPVIELFERKEFVARIDATRRSRRSSPRSASASASSAGGPAPATAPLPGAIPARRARLRVPAGGGAARGAANHRRVHVRPSDRPTGRARQYLRHRDIRPARHRAGRPRLPRVVGRGAHTVRDQRGGGHARLPARTGRRGHLARRARPLHRLPTGPELDR